MHTLKQAVDELFVMDYDNIPGKGPLILFKKLDDGTMTLATPGHIVEFARSILQKCDKLQSFKDWVHAYLDGKGIPHHPPGVHGAEGCRIGDRMDYVFERFHHDTGRNK